MERLLDIENLTTHFVTDDGVARAVDGVSFHVAAGETLGLVGESGCGKSVTALSVLRLLPSPPARIVAGQVWFEDRDLLRLSRREMRAVRGDEIAMVFQEPMTSLNPVYRIGDQIAESLLWHASVSREAADANALEMLARVGIPDPEEAFDRYPHELSGGMRQRAMLAMALICRPALLIADEPTTALDVTIQAQILALLESLRRDLGMSVLLITHNLAIVAELATRAVVMYAGTIVEIGALPELYERPRHPYTMGLLRSIADLGAGAKHLRAIPGSVPDPRRWPAGCRFHPRCERATDVCRTAEPALEDTGGGHLGACWHMDT